MRHLAQNAAELIFGLGDVIQPLKKELLYDLSSANVAEEGQEVNMVEEEQQQTRDAVDSALSHLMVAAADWTGQVGFTQNFQRHFGVDSPPTRSRPKSEQLGRH